MAARRPEQVATAGVLRTFQNGRVFGNLTVAENVSVGLHRELSAHRPLKGLAGNPVLGWLPLLGETLAALLPLPGDPEGAGEDRGMGGRRDRQIP